MGLKDDINRAIAAHGIWKGRLRTAIETGKSDIPVSKIRVDNQCDFGKWLYGSSITMDVKNSDHYKKCKEAHAKFHEAAAKVVELAVNKETAEAEKMMKMGGEYARASSDLTAVMMAWMKTA